MTLMHGTHTLSSYRQAERTHKQKLKVRQYDAGKSGYGPRLTVEEWQRFKPMLVHLNNKGLSRRDIVKTATAEHGFRGTYAALNKRFKDWNLTNTKTPPANDASQDYFVQSSTTSAASATSVASEAKLDTPAESEQDANSMAGSCGSPEASSKLHLATQVSARQQSPNSRNSVDRPRAMPLDEDDISKRLAFEPVIMLRRGSSACEHAELVSEPTSPKVASKSRSPATDQLHNKRPRSQVSSIRSSLFSATSSARNFVQLAKRLRLQPPRLSYISLSQSSVPTPYQSSSFASVTGLEPELSDIPEYQSEKKQHVSVHRRLSDADRKVIRSDLDSRLSARGLQYRLVLPDTMPLATSEDALRDGCHVQICGFQQQSAPKQPGSVPCMYVDLHLEGPHTFVRLDSQVLGLWPKGMSSARRQLGWWKSSMQGLDAAAWF